MNEAWLIWSVVYGAIGIGYLVYGRRQSSIMHFISGLALIGAPYVVPSTLGLIITGVVFILAPFYIRL